MKSATNTLPDQPVNGVTAGLDWARDDHAVSIVDHRGRQIERATLEHSAAGLGQLVALLIRLGAGEVAIERPDGPVVDTLLEAGITVVVISPNQLKNLRGRFGIATDALDFRVADAEDRPWREVGGKWSERGLESGHSQPYIATVQSGQPATRRIP